MKFGNFLFPESRDPARDGAVLDDTVREAELCDRLGMDAIWLSEHHFDGNSVYADPLMFATALAMRTTRVALGFAVIQTSLYHPIHLAEQLALLDHLSKGRLLVGLGRGTFFNIYEYEGFGLDADEAQARFGRPSRSCSRRGPARGFGIADGSGICACTACARCPSQSRIRRSIAARRPSNRHSSTGASDVSSCSTRRATR